jgi:hypothetical protein
MKPRMLNIVCAHPIAISWCLGAAVLDTAVISSVAGDLSNPAVLLRPTVLLCLTLATVSATILGYFLGMFTCWPLARVVCSRLNGAPFRIGDTVLILSGPRKGTMTRVYDTCVGQGGWNLLKLELEPQDRTDYSDIFEEYSVLRICRTEEQKVSGE